jgi:phage terminase Nu1 subunit (DNA packaging protein)
VKTDANPNPVRDLTREELAVELDVHPESIGRYGRLGAPREMRGGRGGRGGQYYYNAAEFIAWMKSRKLTGEKGRPSDTPDSPDLENARLRKENALASKYELQVQRERAELVPVTEVKQWIGQNVTAAKNKFIGLGAGVTPLLEGRDAAERQAIIDARVAEILGELASA